MVAYSIIRVTNDPWRRMASSSLARIAVALCLLLALASFPSKASVSELERARYEAAVAHCRSKPNQLSLNDDRSIFCFDGDVTRERDASSLESLNSGGLFVVRSSGGSGEVAARIATLLEGKEVTVVIHDYCLSACASYFFIASARTYVLKDSIVAWHHSKWRGWTPCEEYGLKYLSWDNVLHATEELCYKHSEPYLRRFGEILSVALPFFKRRIVDLEQFNFSDKPQSEHIATILELKTRGGGRDPEVLWTWNPRYHKQVLRTEVVYEKYPESQDDVDALMQRFFGKDVGRGAVIHDP